MKLHGKIVPADPPRSPLPIEVERTMVENDLLTCQAELAKYDLSERRKLVAGLHPILMGRIYFPEWMSQETPDFHWEIVDGYVNLSRFGVAAPVGSAKTTMLTKLGAIWSALFEPWCWDILIISAAMELTSTWIDDMGRRCKASDELKEDFGEFWGSHWGSTELEFLVPDAHGKMAHAFIRGLGKGGSTRGRRPDRIVIDDPEDEESLKSDKQRADTRDWLFGPVINRLNAPYKKLTYIGTCITPECLLVSLINNPPSGWIVKSYAMLDPATNKSLWEKAFPASFLNQRREEIGEERFQAEFQNNPVRNWHQRLFDVSKIKLEEYTPLPNDVISLCVDPAFVVGGDAWALTMIAVDEKTGWHLLNWAKGRTGTEGWLEALLEMSQRHPRITRVGIEGGGTQQGMSYTVEQFMRNKGINLPVEWIRRSQYSGRKTSRIANLTNVINTGRFSMPNRAAELKEEIQSYRSGLEHQEDHLLDSLAMQLEVQHARQPRERHDPTPEDIRRQRFERYRSTWRRAHDFNHGGTPSRWDRYIES